VRDVLKNDFNTLVKVQALVAQRFTQMQFCCEGRKLSVNQKRTCHRLVGGSCLDAVLVPFRFAEARVP